MDKLRNPNRLINEKSPYLLQHANNPVNWYPWGDEAFKKASQENKPVFLSIGYSTCHWCHVMERESFEDEEVAELLNKYFVAIKVDREERPDVDHIYMTFCQSLTGQGGWPLTIIMTPEKKPFFAGTYIPKRDKWGRTGLMKLLEGVRVSWAEDRDKVIDVGERIMETVSPGFTSSAGELSENVLQRAYQQFKASFDVKYGGFGNAPKFPTPHNLYFLLRYWKSTGESDALKMVEKTLDAMSKGGIYDHIGYGFARYSTDEKWLAPHFEKMLYDNALLTVAYLEAYQITGKEQYAVTARQVLDYVLRDMTSPEGSFYSAEDADSEGVEGKFYVWTPAEVIAVLGEEEGELYCRVFDITKAGNFEGHSIPNLIKTSVEEYAVKHNQNEAELKVRLNDARQKLFAYREKRVHPYKDDKILTAWNGLMIAALAKGFAVLRDERYNEAAQRAVDFIWQKLRRKDGRLLARYRDGEAAFTAYLDDYTFLTWGLIELFEANFKADNLSKALSLTSDVQDLFWDKVNGGFFFYGSDAEELIARPKEVYDGAMPSGNSVAALNLLRLARLTGNVDIENLAEKQLKAFAGDISGHPRAFTYSLTALQFALGTAREIVIAGKLESKEMQEMIMAVQKEFVPGTVLVARPENDTAIGDIIPFVKEHLPVNGRATAYVCENFACRAPVNNIEELTAMIRA